MHEMHSIRTQHYASQPTNQHLCILLSTYARAHTHTHSLSAGIINVIIMIKILYGELRTVALNGMCVCVLNQDKMPGQLSPH